MARTLPTLPHVVAVCCLMLYACSLCYAACPPTCPKNQYCSRGKCTPKKRAKAACASGRECLYGICFKKTCREVNPSLVYEIVERKDATWVALKRAFQKLGGVEYAAAVCPYPTQEPNSVATGVGIVHSIELEETSYCYSTKQFGCLPGGKGVSSIKVTCWGINPTTTLPVPRGLLAAVSPKKFKNPLRVQPSPPAGNIVRKVLGTRRFRSGLGNKIAGFTQLWVSDHITTITGAWPYEACAAKPDGCLRTVPPKQVNALKCPPKTALSGLRLAVLKGTGGDSYVGVDRIYCQDPLGEEMRLR